MTIQWEKKKKKKKMAARSFWQGSISFGLVNIPVKLYATADTSKDFSFNQLDVKGHKIQYKKWCPVEDKEVPYSEIKKGYRISKDNYVVIEKEDLDKIKLKTRPYGNNPFDDKPVAIMSASIGMLGGARAQYQLRQMFVFLNVHSVNGPEVIVTFAQTKFDSNGKLIDENTKKFLKQLLENLANWTRRLRGKSSI
jgi:hypothetical protein